MPIQQVLKLSEIRENAAGALRGAKSDDPAFLGLINSIRQKGFISQLLVREQVDPNTAEKFYELIDGCQRYNAAKAAGLTEVPCLIDNTDKVDAYEKQLMLNLHGVSTKPFEFSKHLKRILASSTSTVTVGELASRLGVSPTWINQRMGLASLPEDIGKEVDAGKINVTNAIALTKLPESEQVNFIADAMTMPPNEFTSKISNRVGEIRKAASTGQKPPELTYTPTSYVRNKSEIEAALSGTVEVGTTIEDALKWVLHLDPVSVEAGRVEFEKRKAEKEAAKAKAAEERAAKKAAAEKLAAETQAKIAETIPA